MLVCGYSTSSGERMHAAQPTGRWADGWRSGCARDIRRSPSQMSGCSCYITRCYTIKHKTTSGIGFNRYVVTVTFWLGRGFLAGNVMVGRFICIHQMAH